MLRSLDQFKTFYVARLDFRSKTSRYPTKFPVSELKLSDIFYVYLFSDQCYPYQ